MPMEPHEIKAALKAKKVKQADIARSVAMSRQHVCDVIAGHRDNAEIKREIAARIGKPVGRVFGAAA